MDLFWICEEFLNFNVNFGKIVVYGYMFINYIEVWCNWIGIDIGVFVINVFICLVF